MDMAVKMSLQPRNKARAVDEYVDELVMGEVQLSGIIETMFVVISQPLMERKRVENSIGECDEQVGYMLLAK